MNSLKFILLLFIAICNFLFAANSQNLALHKSYQLSVSPNYAKAGSDSDRKSLTDGVYTSGKYFWREATTVGWQTKEVRITIDIGKSAPISDVTFNTIRNAGSGINFPQNIFVFVSDDNKEYRYVGDAADIPENVPGDLQIRKFDLDHINASARYIVLDIVSSGQFIFCDEIEVLQGKKFNNLAFTILKDSLTEFIDSLKAPSISKRELSTINKQLVTNTKEAADINFRLKKVISSDQLSEIKMSIGKNHAAELKGKFGVPYILEKYNPWDTLSEFREPKQNESNLNYQFMAPLNCVQYGAFIITNSSPDTKQFTFSISRNQSIFNIELYEIPFVPASYFKTVPDPLINVPDNISINPGSSRLFIFKIIGKLEGSANSSIAVSSSGVNQKIDLSVEIFKLYPQTNILNANVWAYFDKPMTRSFKDKIAADLKDHHINTLVIPPNILPDLKSRDFTSLTEYINYYPEAKNILLFMGYSSEQRRNGYKNGEFFSSEWRSYFISWYNSIQQELLAIKNSGVQVYLYPYDEVDGANVTDLKKLIIWAKKSIPGVKFYATIGSDLAIDSILPLIDLAQINISAKKFNNLPVHNAQLWIYGGSTPSRTLSPYGFYRLMAWDAFLNDYTGVGFWTYADERNANKLNLISGRTFNPAGSYSVIYNDPQGDVISSRRWEAFRLGIEDYYIIQAYSKRKGIEKAKAMAKQVLGNPTNLNLADSVRNKMISSLFD